MTDSPIHRRCAGDSGHEDWAAYFLGDIRRIDNVEVRRQVLDSLVRAKMRHQLPAFAIATMLDLAKQEGQDVSGGSPDPPVITYVDFAGSRRDQGHAR